MKLAIVIVNYRTAPLVIDCLRSLQGQIGGNRVLIADNASGDDSMAVLRRAIDENGWYWASVLPLEKNGGFAYGNNATIRAALTWPGPLQYIWLLNPDTLAHPGALETLAAFMDSHPQAGICGSRLEDAAGHVQRSAFRFHSVAGELLAGLRLDLAKRLLRRWVVALDPPDQPTKVDWVSGASLMIRRAVLEQIGLLDDEYFMYFEETDFCRRAKRAGWECWHVPAARVTHLEGAASGINNLGRPRPAYWYASRHRYFRKNHGWMAALMADVLRTAGVLLWRLRNLVQHKPPQDPPGLMSGIWKSWLVPQEKGE